VDPSGGIFLGGKFTTNSVRVGAVLQQYDANGEMVWDGSGKGGAGDSVEQLIVATNRLIVRGQFAAPGMIGCGSLNMPAGTTSSVASFIRLVAPSLSSVRISGTDFNVSAPFSFRIESMVVGTPPFAFQWYKDGILMSGETSASVFRYTSSP